MKLTFVSNYINHHQIPVSNELYRLLGVNYAFIQTEPVEEERLKMGWQDESGELPYLRLFYEEPEQCRRLIMESDAVVFGGTDDESYIKPRLEEGKLILRYSERVYKSGQWKAISPRGLRKKYQDHTKYRNSPVYLLCAGGYVASDFHIIRAYPDKMLKWGYFPETRHYDINELLKKHEKCADREGQAGHPEQEIGAQWEKDTVSILWAGRFIDWKHPELPILLAEYLKKKGYDFHLSMVGGGEMEEELRRMVAEKGLEIIVEFCGYLRPEQVREKMEQSEIYLFTSDYKEGWGAVLNEAMNSGCAVLASHAIGAVPFLMKHGENGLIFESGNLRDLEEKAEELLTDAEKRKRLGKAAYRTITEEWNAELAAERLAGLAERLLEQNPLNKEAIKNEKRNLTVKKMPEEIKQTGQPWKAQRPKDRSTEDDMPVNGLSYQSGPLSGADIIPPRKMYQYLMQ